MLRRNANAGAGDTTKMDTDEGGEVDDGPLNLPFGQLYFGFPVVSPPNAEDDKQEKTKQIFTGSGQTLRTKKK